MILRNSTVSRLTSSHRSSQAHIRINSEYRLPIQSKNISTPLFKNRRLSCTFCPWYLIIYILYMYVHITHSVSPESICSFHPCIPFKKFGRLKSKAIFYLCLSNVLANERWWNICNICSYWLKTHPAQTEMETEKEPSFNTYELDITDRHWLKIWPWFS